MNWTKRKVIDYVLALIKNDECTQCVYKNRAQMTVLKVY